MTWGGLLTVLVMGGYAGSMITEEWSTRWRVEKQNSRDSAFQLMGL